MIRIKYFKNETAEITLSYDELELLKLMIGRGWDPNLESNRKLAKAFDIFED